MEIISASKDIREQFLEDIPQLVWDTGPVSYQYHFGDRELFDAIIKASWLADGTLFAADTTRLAIEDEQLLGIEIGMAGNEFRQRQDALGPVWRELVNNGAIDPDLIPGVLERSNHASWLNPWIYPDTYYIHALSVKPEARGKRIGYHLIDHAIKNAKAQEYTQLQLDVLSDNPAVGFYRNLGLEVLAETTAPKPSAFGIPPEYRMGMALS